MARVLVIDNYDSFTHNLVQMFLLFKNLVIDVSRSDSITLRQIEARNPDYLVISPGPKDPANAGVSVAVVRKFTGKKQDQKQDMDTSKHFHLYRETTGNA